MRRHELGALWFRWQIVGRRSISIRSPMRPACQRGTYTVIRTSVTRSPSAADNLRAYSNQGHVALVQKRLRPKSSWRWPPTSSDSYELKTNSSGAKTQRCVVIFLQHIKQAAYAASPPSLQTKAFSDQVPRHNGVKQTPARNPTGRRSTNHPAGAQMTAVSPATEKKLRDACSDSCQTSPNGPTGGSPKRTRMSRPLSVAPP